MIGFGVIGFLILVLVFVITRNQGIQREFIQVQHTYKLLQSQNKYSLGIVMTMSTQLQYTFQTKLADLKRHGLINVQDHDIIDFILDNFQFIIVQCMQHNETVEIAVRKALKGQELTIGDVSQFIARQPTEVKVPWCKNTVEGFISACRNLVADKFKTETTPETVSSTDIG
jgi:hypothetical protein